MMYGLSAGAWFNSGKGRYVNYTYRYSDDWHCDLMESLSDYRAAPNMKLDEIAAAVGLPGKLNGHGSEVEAMVQRGEIEKVRAYCECDCLNLFALYVRWGLVSGRMDAAGHNASIASLVRRLEEERHQRPHFGEFLDCWRESLQPVPMLVPERPPVPLAVACDQISQPA
jgi:predicted PolB exonuclease-like 3'-5' exonuclease